MMHSPVSESSRRCMAANGGGPASTAERPMILARRPGDVLSDVVALVEPEARDRRRESENHFCKRHMGCITRVTSLTTSPTKTRWVLT
jgi:hypothetical protein